MKRQVIEHAGNIRKRNVALDHNRAASVFAAGRQAQADRIADPAGAKRINNSNQGHRSQSGV